MSKHRVASMCATFFLLLFAQAVSADFDPPSITPANPVAGEMVSVNIGGGLCQAIFDGHGYPRITRQDDAIRILEYGDPDMSGWWCLSPPHWVVSRAIGVFAPGDYTLTVDLAYEHPFFGPSIMNIGVVHFTVAAPPASVPTINAVSASALLLALILVAGWALRRNRTLLPLMMLACLPFSARAQDTQTIQILLSNAPGAPTPEQVVAWLKASKKSAIPPMAAFSVKSPLAGDYLIPDRATGDFRAWLNANPDSARKKLEDFVLATFLAAEIPAALAALQADPYVTEAVLTPQYEWSGVELTAFEVVSEGPLAGNDQYGWFDMNLDATWRLASGYAFVGQIDMGLFEQHAALRQFNGSTYVGGNFVKAASRDVGLTGQPAQSGFDPLNVDEKKLMWVDAGPCTTVGAYMPPAILGHGTHAAGLLGANGVSGLGVQGTCKQCGISAWKATYLGCFPSVPPRVQPILNGNAVDRAQTQTVDTGVQVLSQSYGQPNANQTFRCQTYGYHPKCLGIAYAAGRDVAIVASSGNRRESLNFPASETRVISAGGFQPDLAFWDDSPGSSTNCPPPPSTAECGSNFSKPIGGQYYRTHQELLGSAKRVLSTTYPNTTWVDYGECGDGYGTPMGDGIGWCTGTSMAAPQIAGVVGLLRSINPLVLQGEPEPIAGEKPGLRTVLAQTASRGSAWDPKVGHGIPDGASAARKVLGTVAGATARNRATPLFRLYQTMTRDFAETTSPQYALSLMINQDKNYVQPGSGIGAQPVVPGYAFPYDAWDPDDPDLPYDSTPPAAPRASIYVLTTEYRPRNEWPDLRPLHLMDKNKSVGKDYLLATTNAEIEAAHTAGYNLRTIQGYVYRPCTPEATCIPPAAQRLWRQFKAADGDCAVFLDSEKAAFEAAGYTAACPTGATKMIGYAYPATDSDGDGLPDGFEYVVGTNPHAADSDGDGVPDATEFPLAGIPVSDPCMGGTLGARNCGADIIFRNGFSS